MLALVRRFLYFTHIGFFVCWYTVACAGDSGAKDLIAAQTAIEMSVNAAKATDEALFKQQKNVEKWQQQAQSALAEVKENTTDIVLLVNYLHHIKHFSPFLTTLVASELKDIVHLNMALSYLTPRVPKRFEKVLTILKHLAQSRQHLENSQLKLSELSVDHKKQVNAIKKQFYDLDELLFATNQSLPLRHFDSEAQISELINRLTVQAMDCQKLTQLPEKESCDLIFAPATIKDNSIHYLDLIDHVVQAPMDGDILLSGNNVETGGVLLIRQNEYIMLIKGMDRILSFVGTKVKQQQPIGIVFESTALPKKVEFTIWQCKQR